MTKIQLFRFNNGMAFMATLVFVILAFQSRSTSANDVSARFWPFSIKSSKVQELPKLCIQSIINTWKKLLSTVTWADKKLTGFWQII